MKKPKHITVQLELPLSTIKTLKEIAKLAGVTSSQVVNVIIASKLVSMKEQP